VLLALVRKHWISQVLRAATTASDAGGDLELVEGVGEHVAKVPEVGDQLAAADQAEESGCKMGWKRALAYAFDLTAN